MNVIFNDIATGSICALVLPSAILFAIRLALFEGSLDMKFAFSREVEQNFHDIPK